MTTLLPVFVLEDVLLPGAVARLDADEGGAALARALLASAERRVVTALRKGETEVHDIASLAMSYAVSIERSI